MESPASCVKGFLWCFLFRGPGNNRFPKFIVTQCNGLSQFDKHQDHKQCGQEKVYFSLQVRKRSISACCWEKLRHEPRSRTEAETVEECFLLAYFPALLSLIFYTTLDNVFRGGSAHRGLALPPSPSNQQAIKCPHRLFWRPIYGGIFSFEVLLSQMTLST